MIKPIRISYNVMHMRDTTAITLNIYNSVFEYTLFSFPLQWAFYFRWTACSIYAIIRLRVEENYIYFKREKRIDDNKIYGFYHSIIHSFSLFCSVAIIWRWYCTASHKFELNKKVEITQISIDRFIFVRIILHGFEYTYLLLFNCSNIYLNGSIQSIKVYMTNFLFTRIINQPIGLTIFIVLVYVWLNFPSVE